jgi:anti-sigma B factor antagonist
MRTSVDRSAAAVLTIEGEMTIYRALELKQSLLAALGHGTTICELDLSKVTELDSAGVQLLMLVRQLADARGRQVRIVAHSPQVHEVLTLMNLAGYLETPPGDK